MKRTPRYSRFVDAGKRLRRQRIALKAEAEKLSRSKYGKPPSFGRRQRKLQIRVSEPEWIAIAAARGELPVGTFIRRVLRDFIQHMPARVA